MILEEREIRLKYKSTDEVMISNTSWDKTLYVE